MSPIRTLNLVSVQCDISTSMPLQMRNSAQLRIRFSMIRSWQKAWPSVGEDGYGNRNPKDSEKDRADKTHIHCQGNRRFRIIIRGRRSYCLLPSLALFFSDFSSSRHIFSLLPLPASLADSLFLSTWFPNLVVFDFIRVHHTSFLPAVQAVGFYFISPLFCRFSYNSCSFLAFGY